MASPDETRHQYVRWLRIAGEGKLVGCRFACVAECVDIRYVVGYRCVDAYVSVVTEMPAAYSPDVCQCFAAQHAKAVLELPGLLGFSHVEGQLGQPETRSLAHQHDRGTQRNGRFLQAITGFQMTNEDLAHALRECKRESGTYNCPSNEESYGALATWNISSVTSLSQGKLPLALRLA